LGVLGVPGVVDAEFLLQFFDLVEELPAAYVSLPFEEVCQVLLIAFVNYRWAKDPAASLPTNSPLLAGLISGRRANPAVPAVLFPLSRIFLAADAWLSRQHIIDKCGLVIIRQQTKLSSIFF
jgi:hypothetical protein